MTWEMMLLDPRSPFWLCILQKKSSRGRRCDRSGDELEGVAPYGLSRPCQGEVTVSMETLRRQASRKVIALLLLRHLSSRDHATSMGSGRLHVRSYIDQGQICLSPSQGP